MWRIYSVFKYIGYNTTTPLTHARQLSRVGRSFPVIASCPQFVATCVPCPKEEEVTPARVRSRSKRFTQTCLTVLGMMDELDTSQLRQQLDKNQESLENGESLWFHFSKTSSCQWCGLRPSVLSQDQSQTKKIDLGFVLGLVGLVLRCETRSCYPRRHNDLERQQLFKYYL